MVSKTRVFAGVASGRLVKLAYQATRKPKPVGKLFPACRGCLVVNKNSARMARRYWSTNSQLTPTWTESAASIRLKSDKTVR